MKESITVTIPAKQNKKEGGVRVLDLTEKLQHDTSRQYFTGFCAIQANHLWIPHLIPNILICIYVPHLVFSTSV
jgi:hypothetical protein